ncbi:glycosyltransferase family 25 protein [Devosia sp. A8/3-2]|nr:glycosyltransferase family 25 protein [Devosia sp. A8/3-2]
MRCYYINSARRTDRRAIMEQRFTGLGLRHERVEALTPAAITPEQRARYCNPAAHARQSDGELACSLSHLQAMRQFLATSAPYAAIFEDDAIPAPSLPALLDQFEQAAPQVDILRLRNDQYPHAPPAPR